MTIQREDWARRWRAVPGLRPTELLVRHDDRWAIELEGCECSDETAAALIAWRAVEWLHGNYEVCIVKWMGAVNVRLANHLPGGDEWEPEFRAGTLLDALGAAVEAVLEARG